MIRYSLMTALLYAPAALAWLVAVASYGTPVLWPAAAVAVGWPALWAAVGLLLARPLQDWAEDTQEEAERRASSTAM